MATSMKGDYSYLEYRKLRSKTLDREESQGSCQHLLPEESPSIIASGGW